MTPIQIMKRNARKLVAMRVRRGKMTKGPCEVCAEVKVEAHHEDYSKPLEVRWLCQKHHQIETFKREERAVYRKAA